MLTQRWASHAINFMNFIYVIEILLMLAQYWGNDVFSLENNQNNFILYNVGSMLAQRCEILKICIFV